MTNPTVLSTLISAPAKTGHNDTSDVSKSDVQLAPQYPQCIEKRI
jgi:hypothetical protein